MSDREGKVIPSRIIRHLPGPPMPTGGSDFSVEWDDEFVVAHPRLQASATAELAAALGCRLEHGQLLRDGTGEDDAHQLSLELVERGYTVGVVSGSGWQSGPGIFWRRCASVVIEMGVRTDTSIKSSSCFSVAIGWNVLAYDHWLDSPSVRDIVQRNEGGLG